MLIDFGTARAIISDRSATHVGSPGYSPIEQITARGKRGPWTDVYSLGATCYRLITGVRPPEANERLTEEEDPLLPLAPRADLYGRFSPEFLATIDKALALRGKQRWQTAAEWLAVLPVPASQPTPEQASPTTPEIATTPIAVAPEPSPRPRRNVTLILLILALAPGIPGGYMLYQHTQTMAEQRLLVKQEAERQAREEAERKAKEEAERKAREDALLKLSAKGISESQYNRKIIEAAANGDNELLTLLITAGADVNAANGFGWTPLIWAAFFDRYECVKILLSVPGIDVNKSRENGETALQIAEQERHTECARLIREAGGHD